MYARLRATGQPHAGAAAFTAQPVKHMSCHTSIALVLSSSLAACVVVPVDPRTGMPYPHTPVSAQSQPVPVVPALPLASTIGVRLYPLNDMAAASGMLNATVVDHHSGKGSFSLNYRGDILQGEATRVDGGYPAFGRLHDDVLGRSPRFKFGEDMALEVLGEAFNLFNRFQVTGVNTGAYTISGTNLNFNAATFGVPNSAGNSNIRERQIQLAARFHF